MQTSSSSRPSTTRSPLRSCASCRRPRSADAPRRHRPHHRVFALNTSLVAVLSHKRPSTCFTPLTIVATSFSTPCIIAIDILTFSARQAAMIVSAAAPSCFCVVLADGAVHRWFEDAIVDVGSSSSSSASGSKGGSAESGGEGRDCTLLQDHLLATDRGGADGRALVFGNNRLATSSPSSWKSRGGVRGSPAWDAEFQVARCCLLLPLRARATSSAGRAAYPSGVLASFLLYIMMNGTRDPEHYWFR